MKGRIFLFTLFFSVLALHTQVQAGPHCASLLLRTPETIRELLTDGGLYSDLVPIAKIDELDGSKWYQRNRRKIFSDLRRPLDSFKTRDQLDHALIRMTAYFYPLSISRSMGFGKNALMDSLINNAQRTLLRGGIYQFIEASELPASQKESWLRSTSKLPISLLKTLLNPMRLTRFLYRDLTFEEARSILYDGIEGARSKFPQLMRDNAMRLAATHLRLFGNIALLSFAVVAQSTQQQNASEAARRAADARADQKIVELDGIRQSLSPDTEAVFITQLKEAAFRSYIKAFEESVQRKATGDEISYLRMKWTEFDPN